jgi:chemotaxis signal transduction protein
MADSQAVRVVVFQVGDLACGIPANRAREILAPLPTTRIPGAPETVVGLVNIRGSLLTVVDGHLLLGRTRDPDHEGALLVVDVGARRLGLSVGRVDDLFEVPAGQLEAREALPGVDVRLVKAVGRREGRHFVVLDLDALLAPLLSAAAGGDRPISRPS